jgi:hypothetical protein
MTGGGGGEAHAGSLRDYADLLRRYPAFRNLWFAQQGSTLGENALYIGAITLITELSPTAWALTGFMLCSGLPAVVFGPVAGVAVDSFDRRWIMICSDAARMLIVLLLLFVDRASRLWLLYATIGFMYSFQAFFSPARSALIPSLLPLERVASANALSSVSDSLLTALGSSFGGLFAAWAGLPACFLLDAVTYLLSAAWVLAARIPRAIAMPRRTDAPPSALELAATSGSLALDASPRPLLSASETLRERAAESAEPPDASAVSESDARTAAAEEADAEAGVGHEAAGGLVPSESIAFSDAERGAEPAERRVALSASQHSLQYVALAQDGEGGGSGGGSSSSSSSSSSKGRLRAGLARACGCLSGMMQMYSEGMRYMWVHRELAWMVAVKTTGNVTMGALEITNIALIERSFSLVSLARRAYSLARALPLPLTRAPLRARRRRRSRWAFCTCLPASPA